MKKLFLFATLTFFAFTSNAQELNFEETVKYIQGKIECCSNVQKIEVSKNGLVKFQYKNSSESESFNLFDLYTKEDQTSISELKNREDYKRGFGYNELNIAIFFFLAKSRITTIKMTSENDAQRVSNAFKKVLTLCTKEKDPFDN